MTLKSILIIVQCVCIVGIFMEILLILRKMKNSLHLYLLLSFIALLTNEIGYLLELISQNKESYTAALKFSYFGKIWYAFLMFLFVTELTRIKIPTIIKYLLLSFQAFTYMLIFTVEYNTLYYSYFDVKQYNGFMRSEHGNGVIYRINMTIQILYIAAGIYFLVKDLNKRRRKRERRCGLTVIAAVLIEAIFLIVQLIRIPGVSEYYDVTMVGYFIGTILMLIAIISFNLLGTVEIAKEFVIDRISEGIIAVDNEDVIEYYNNPAQKIYPGLGPDPLLKFDHGEICWDDDEILNGIKEAVAKKSNIVIGDRIYTPEANDLFSGDEIIGKIYALVDDTEHYQYMSELEKQKEIADNANMAKSRFLAGMSHEIRTPINAVLGFDEMIIRESSEKNIRKYAADIMSAGKTLLSLINDILDLSKAEEGKIDIIPQQYELSSLINDLNNLIRSRAEKKGLRFYVDVNSRIPHMLIGDEVRIRQCVTNLLTNAVKYTEKGTVTLRVSFADTEDEDASHIMLFFEVEDTGIGIKPEDLEQLFSPYKRIEEQRNHRIEGTGLGMSITRHLLELMGSELKVDTEFGKGTKVSFEIRQEIVSKEEIGDFNGRISDGYFKEAYRELFHAPEGRIMVVDDTEMNLTVIQSLLKKTQIRIDTADRGEKAIMLASVNEYDVLFIDHMMPDMDGIETLSAIRKDGKNTETPAIALTANAVSGARQTYLDAGFTDYLSKPVDGEKLEKMLMSFLPDKKIRVLDGGEDLNKENASADSTVVLVIDDDETVCLQIKNILAQDYLFYEAHTAAAAVPKATEFLPDIILLDIHLGDGNGFSVMQELKENHITANIPVLMITGDNDSVMEENGFKSGAADYVRKPFVPDVLRQRVKRIIDLHRYQRSIEEEVTRQTGKSRRLSRQMMLTLSKTVDIKDHYTDGHSRRVAAICAEIGRRLGKSDEEQLELYEAGLMHDIGKIGIHEDIIRKSSDLSDEEFAAVKEHTIKGYEILKEIKDMPDLCNVARWHHERYDGSGYPDGLKAEEIPENARIACVADCYDAMTSTRTYSVPRSREDVRAEILRCRGSWFDPAIADVLLIMLDEDTEMKMNEKANGADVWKEFYRLWENDSANNMETGSKDIVPSILDEKTDTFPEWLNTIPEIDKDMGVKKCGGIDGYLSVLFTFHKTASYKADEIEKFLNDSDMENYTIKVHALKSSARIIGAKELADLSEKLEKAGRENDSIFIEGNTGILLEMYRKLDKGLSAMDKINEDLPLIAQSAMQEAYQTIAEISQSMDYEMMDELLKKLRQYRLDPPDDETITTIEQLLTVLDWDEIEKMAKSKMVSY